MIQNKISQIISILLHPLLMPIVGVFIIQNFGTSSAILSFEFQNLIYTLVGVTTIIIPLMIIPILLSFRVIKSINMETSTERITPLFFTTLSFFSCYIILGLLPNSIPYPEKANLYVIRSFIFAAGISTTLCMIISVRWKISAHMIGIGGLISTAIVFAFKLSMGLQDVIMIIVALSGLLGYARIQLKAHTSAQVYVGFLLGFIVMFVLLWFKL